MMGGLPLVRLAAAALAVSAAGAAGAAGTEDWPCVQRKVPEVSLAAIWTGPPPDAAARKWREVPEIAGLVEHLAQRRTSEQEARQAIARLAASSGGAKRERLLSLLAGLVETVNGERADVIAGIERFGQVQKQLAALVRDGNAKLAALRGDAKADPATVAALSERLNWDLRIFDERQKSLRFVCEVPVLIEQRLFMLARAIADELR
jgi:hypothetical protein